MSWAIKDLHKKIDYNQRQLEMFKVIDSNVDSSVNQLRERWEESTETIRAYNTDLANMKDVSGILGQAILLKNIAVMGAAFDRLELQTVSEGAAELVEAVSSSLDDVFGNLGAHGIANSGRSSAPIESADEVLEIVNMY